MVARTNTLYRILLFSTVVAIFTIQNIEIAIAVETSTWRRITLSNGISFQLPNHWKILSKRQTAELYAKSKIHDEIYIVSSKLPFSANEVDRSGRTVALLNVRTYPTLEISQTEVRLLAQTEIEMYDLLLKKGLLDGARLYGLQLLSWGGTKPRSFGKTLALESQYRRVSLTGKGVFRVRLVRIMDGSRSFTLTVSYLEARKIISAPIVEFIVNSLQPADQ